MTNVSSTLMGNNSLVYTDSYTTSSLNTSDEGRIYECEGVINASPPVIDTANIILNVTGMYVATYICA